jgi:hypothetical protein
LKTIDAGSLMMRLFFVLREQVVEAMIEERYFIRGLLTSSIIGSYSGKIKAVA